MTAGYRNPLIYRELSNVPSIQLTNYELMQGDEPLQSKWFQPCFPKGAFPHDNRE